MLIIAIIIQVIGESLPVSSSGHLVLVDKFLSLFDSSMYIADLPGAVDTVLHIPTIFIIIFFFWADVTKIIYPLIASLKSRKTLIAAQQQWRFFMRTIIHVALAVIVTVMFYMVIREWCYNVSWLRGTGMLSCGFAITTVELLSLRWVSSRSYQPLTNRRALLLGSAQGIALLPGISRLATTYVVARWLKLSPQNSFGVSFLIALPVMIAGILKDALPAVIHFLKGMLHHEARHYVTIDWNLFLSWPIVLTLLVASGVSYFVLGRVQQLVFKEKFWCFGLYTVVPTLFTATIWYVGY